MSPVKAEDVIHVAQIVRYGDKLVVPETMPLESAIKVLTVQMQDEEVIIAIEEAIDCFPWEGAIAFKKAIEQTFGYGGTVATPGFFGPVPPKEIAIETGVNTKVSCPWGRFRFALGTDKEWLGTGTSIKEGRMIFTVTGEVKKKWKSTILKLADLTREIVRRESIYRGHPLRIAFTDDNAKTIGIPTPKFLDLSKVRLDELVYTRELTELIDTNIMTPLRHAGAVRASGIPLKRGVLAAGPYGTGKSILARAVAKVATENGWTFVYIKDASELPHAYKFAALYQPSVIFAEDVDRFMGGEERTAAMDMILNTLDGIDSKTTEIMVILTTNHLEQVNRAMLRPGRLDVILEITPPDAEAVTRLIRVYGRDSLNPKADLDEAGVLLKGLTPAVIREVVERSKLASIKRTGKANSKVIGTDIEVAAKTMLQQQNLLAPPKVVEETWPEGLVTNIAAEVFDKLKGDGLGKMEVQVRETHERVAKHLP